MSDFPNFVDFYNDFGFRAKLEIWRTRIASQGQRAYGATGESSVQGGKMDIKKDRQSEDRLGTSDIGVAFAAVHAADAAKKEKSDDEKMSLFWRVFGGTIFSIIALVGVTIYNNLASNISELRAEIARINEARAELVKRDDLNSRFTGLNDVSKTLVAQNATQNATLTALQASDTEFKDRLTALKAESDTARKEVTGQLEMAKKDFGTAIDAIRKEQAVITDGLKKEVATLEVVREQLKAIEVIKKDVEGIRKEIAAIESLRERATGLATEFKDVRETVNKMRQDVDRNAVSDAERKKARDEQYAKLLDTIKEMDKAARACSEKVARLEGTMAPAPMPMTPPKKLPEKSTEKPNEQSPEGE